MYLLGDGYSISRRFYFPILYQDVRSYAVNYHNGNMFTDGEDIDVTADIVSYIGTYYDYDLYVSTHKGKSSIKELGLSSIAFGYPFIFATDDDGDETDFGGNHAFMAYGYQKYEITRKIIFKFKQTKYFVEVLDGQNYLPNSDTGNVPSIYFNISDYSKKGYIMLINEWNKVFNPDGVAY